MKDVIEVRVRKELYSIYHVPTEQIYEDYAKYLMKIKKIKYDEAIKISKEELEQDFYALTDWLQNNMNFNNLEKEFITTVLENDGYDELYFDGVDDD